MGLVSELRRRNVLRMAALYVVAAWLVMQVAEVLIALANPPEWVGPAVLATLAIGFPLAVILSWFYELTPEGIALDKDAAADTLIPSTTGRRVDFVIIAMLCAALVLFAYDKWWTTGPPDRSVAVLPFVNLSGDPEQEYFSDGISAEILQLMTRISGLKVIDRASSFSFKDKGVDASTIAAQLGVRHLVQGNVRQSGNTVRINAQLIDASDGVHKWSETYERPIDDVFAVQDEIAAAIALALRITVSDELLKSTRIDVEAHRQLLYGTHLIFRGNKDDFESAVDALRSSVALEPGYAPAWSALYLGYWYLGWYGIWPAEEANSLALDALETAIELDPENPQFHARMGQFIMVSGGDLALSAAHINKALAIDPDDSSTLNGAAQLALQLGRPNQATLLQRRYIGVNPVSPVGHANLCRIYYFSSQFDKAIQSCRTALRLNPNHAWAPGLLHNALLMTPDYESLRERFGEPEELSMTRLLLLHANGQSQQFEQVFAEYRDKYRESAPIAIAFVYSLTDQADQAFAWLERLRVEDVGFTDWHITPFLAPLHDDPRWADFVERRGISKAQLDEIELNVPRG